MLTGRNLNVKQVAVLLTSGPRWPGRDAGEAAQGRMVSLGFPDWVQNVGCLLGKGRHRSALDVRAEVHHGLDGDIVIVPS